MKVVIGSKNPTKQQAVRQAFKLLLPDMEFEFISIDASSDVADQPMSDQESVQGATNRAQNALKQVAADYGVGLEGGQSNVNGTWFTGTAAVVIDQSGKIGIGLSPRVQTPEKTLEHIDTKTNLSAAIAKSHGIEGIGKKQGLSGLVTKGIITRVTSSRDAVVAALAVLL